MFRGTNPYGLDLASINIQRGRDYGVRSYNSYRRLCGLQPFESFEQFPQSVGWFYSQLILKTCYYSWVWVIGAFLVADWGARIHSKGGASVKWLCVSIDKCRPGVWDVSKCQMYYIKPVTISKSETGWANNTFYDPQMSRLPRRFVRYAKLSLTNLCLNWSQPIKVYHTIWPYIPLLWLHFCVKYKSLFWSNRNKMALWIIFL